MNPLSGTSSQAPVIPKPSATTTASAASTAVAPAAPAPSRFAKTPAPRLYDPLLTDGKWGYHSKRTNVENRRTSGVTLALHENLEQAEIDALTAEQKKSLLKIFRNSSKVHKWIDVSGGDSSNATYTVVDIQASDDVGNDTPWAYARLQAGFATNDGVKAIECYVYRLKTDKGLDLHPFVAGAIVGYRTVDGSIVNPKRVRIR